MVESGGLKLTFQSYSFIGTVFLDLYLPRFGSRWGVKPRPRIFVFPQSFLNSAISHVFRLFTPTHKNSTPMAADSRL